MDRQINHLAVWVLVVLHQLIPMGWYSAFAVKWMALIGKNADDFKDVSMTPYFVAIISAIVTVYMTAWLFCKLNIDNAVSGLKTAFLLWFCFLFWQVLTSDQFHVRPLELSLLNAGNTLIIFVVTGLVLGAWQKKNA